MAVKMAAVPTLTGCAWYASMKGWPLLRANLMVEGNLDVEYLRLAAATYLAVNAMSLLGQDLSIFCPGSGDAGGSYGIVEQFPTLWNQSRLDLDASGKVRYRLAALLDNDDEGKKAATLMCKANRGLQLYGNVFLLQRYMPRRSRDAKPLAAHTREQNQAYANVDCVIEDFLDPTLCELYAEEYPHHLTRRVALLNGACQYRWTFDGKFGLRRFVESQASIHELAGLVEVLKSMRYYLGLAPDGVALAA